MDPHALVAIGKVKVIESGTLKLVGIASIAAGLLLIWWAVSWFIKTYQAEAEKLQQKKTGGQKEDASSN